MKVKKVNGVSVKPGSVDSMLRDAMHQFLEVRLEFETEYTGIAKDEPARLELSSPVACAAKHTELLDMAKNDPLMCADLLEKTKDDPVNQEDPLLPECPVSFFVKKNISLFGCVLENRCALSGGSSQFSNAVTMPVDFVQRTSEIVRSALSKSPP